MISTEWSKMMICNREETASGLKIRRTILQSYDSDKVYSVDRISSNPFTSVTLLFSSHVISSIMRSKRPEIAQRTLEYKKSEKESSMIKK